MELIKEFILDLGFTKTKQKPHLKRDYTHSGKKYVNVEELEKLLDKWEIRLEIMERGEKK